MKGIPKRGLIIPTLATPFLHNHGVKCNKEDNKTVYQSDKVGYFKKNDANRIFKQYPEIHINSLNKRSEDCRNLVETLKKSNQELVDIPPECTPIEAADRIKVVIPFGHTIYTKSPEEIEGITRPKS